MGINIHDSGTDSHKLFVRVDTSYYIISMHIMQILFEGGYHSMCSTIRRNTVYYSLCYYTTIDRDKIKLWKTFLFQFFVMNNTLLNIIILVTIKNILIETN